jgi:chromate transporter
MPAHAAATARPALPPSFGELFRVFLNIGLLSFGGPAAQIALMHRVLVEDRKWLSEDDFLRALSFCMLLPGPEAMQLATYAGWKLRGTAGGLMAGLLFVLPGAVVILILAILYALHGETPGAQALLLGVKAAVAAIVLQAMIRLGRRALRNRSDLVIAGLAFAALFLFDLPFPALIAGAALLGWWRGPATATVPADGPLPALSATIRTVALWGAIWLVPLILLHLGGHDHLTALGLYFSTLAVVTFGGAYAALGWMTQTVVADFGWITRGQMMDALGLAETTPGPLILVTQFVGFLAAFRQGGLGLGLAGAAVALWMTFVPCFLWIFAGAPWLDHLTRRPGLNGALAAISAAVVGVIGSLSAWFALHVLFSRVASNGSGWLSLPVPDISSFQTTAAGLTVAAGIMIFWARWPLPLVLALCALGSWGVSVI